MSESVRARLFGSATVGGSAAGFVTGFNEATGRPPESCDRTRRVDRRFACARLRLVVGAASVGQVRLGLGHASAVITLRISVHPWPGREDRTRPAMGAVFGGLRTGCGREDRATGEIAGRAA